MKDDATSQNLHPHIDETEPSPSAVVVPIALYRGAQERIRELERQIAAMQDGTKK